MDVVIVGPGRAGTLLATALSRAGHRVRAIVGGTDAARASVAATVAGVRSVASAADLAALSLPIDLVVLTVPDDAIGPAARELVVAEVVGDGVRLVHVAGSQGVAPLRLAARAGAQVAACHPAMTIPAGCTDPDLLVGVAWAVSASPGSRGWAEELVRQLGGDPFDVPDDRRALYHAALATGSNAVASAAVLARQLLLAAGIEHPERVLGPLARASLANSLEAGAAALTGPVVRGDTGTIASHLAVLDRDAPQLAVAYRHHGAALLSQVRAELPAEVARDLAVLLAAVDAGAPAP